jgi:hypothetical protein
MQSRYPIGLLCADISQRRQQKFGEFSRREPSFKYAAQQHSPWALWLLVIFMILFYRGTKVILFFGFTKPFQRKIFEPAIASPKNDPQSIAFL